MRGLQFDERQSVLAFLELQTYVDTETVFHHLRTALS